MTLAYTKSVLRVVVAQICQTIGWHTIQNSALEILVDILHHYVQDLTKLTHRYSEHYGYTIPNLDHLALAFRDLGINLDELEEYVQFVEPTPCAKDVPKYPMPHDSHLNFLKPGSREVVHRPVHVHEHLPPMHPEMEEDEYNGKQNVNTGDTPGSSNGSSPLNSPKASVFKRPGEPISSESGVSKRSRSAPEEEGRPLREITSVIMTTSGFLSPAREGKLPESRIPIPPSDSRSNSPLPPSYPMVPPEVKGEKKSKKGTVKKSVDGLKRLDKENKKKDMKLKESRKSQKHMLVDDSKVKKLISMKEFSKLKALKTGALKLMARSTSGGSGSKSKMSSSKMSLSKSHSKALKFNKVSSQPKIPKSHPISVMPQPKNVIPCVEKIKAPKTVEGKLSSEPDKQKLNIFKKISKVKEEKFEKDKPDRIDSVDVYPKDSRESSPGLVIDELEIQNQQREARLAQINECINAVIIRGMKEISHDSKQVREAKSQVIPMSSCVSKNDSSVSEVAMAHGPDPSKDVYMFDDNDLSPPGTPSTPKTPELPTPARKLEKILEKKKKKDKSKSKKESKGKLAKDPLSAKKIKVEVNDYENSGRPKTPEVPEPQENIQTPVFPFFPSFPPAPGLIPPPLGHHPLFPRFPLSYTKPGGVLGQPIPSSNLPHPAMPNLPLPPPLFMQPRAEEQPKVKDDSPEKIPPVNLPAPMPAPLPPVVKTEKVEKPQPMTVTSPKEKPVEKKSKEHKKEKKDKEKVKKKKDKKDKAKGKDKSEKKKDKEEKRERDKDKEKGKEKKEKKEKKKDKEREDKSETSVPKLTLKLPSSSPRPTTPDQSRKIVIKTVVKKAGPEEQTPPAGTNEPSSKRAPSPELAKFSALITRPPKQKGSSKPPQPHQEPPAEAPSYHPPPPMPTPQPPVVPPPSLPPEQPPPPPPAPPPPPVMPVPVPSLHSLPSTSATPQIAPPKAKKGLTKPFSKSKPKDASKKAAIPEQDAPKAFYYDKLGNKVWICPACGGQDDGSPMIGCDDCDAWYHWVCVGMQVPPDDNEDWYCRVCIVKKEESLADKKKKARKKK